LIGPALTQAGERMAAKHPITICASLQNSYFVVI
jgi:hypothetical protein